MKEEVDLKEIDSEVPLEHRKVWMLVESKICLSVKKEVLGTDSVVELWG